MNVINHPEIQKIERAALERDWLRAAYDAAVEKIKADRPGRMLGAAFDNTADLVFEAAYGALVQHDETQQARMQVLSAKPGLGKSSYSNAMACAIASCGGGVLICCEQMETVDQRYRDLDKLVPGRVGCYSTDHKKGNKPTKVLNPAAQFDKLDLAKYPVIVTTHEGLKRDDARAFKDWLPGEHAKWPAPRDLIVIDEMVKEIQQYAIDLQAVEHAKARVEADPSAPSHAIAGLIRLELFLQDRIGASVVWRPAIDRLDDDAALTSRRELAWFTTREAEEFAAHSKHKSVAPVFGYAACLHRGWAYTTTYGNETVLMGYHNGLEIGDMPMVQLDGSADISGLRMLNLRDRDILPGPTVNYGGLDAVVETPPTRTAIAKYLGNMRNARTYAKWLDGLIVKHAQPGQKVLVVCKKALLGVPSPDKALYAFPTWGEDSPKWDRINYTTEFGYKVRVPGSPAPIHVAVQWWGGPSTGHNAFQDAEVVILADAQWQPRHTVLADMQGYSRQAPTEGGLERDRGSPVDEMHKLGGLGAKPRRYEAYKLQTMMASYVQAASRGRLRQWSPNGTCGAQKLVCALYDTAWLLDGWDTMFPGARRPEVVGSALPIPKRAQPGKGKTGRGSGRLGRRTGPSAVTLLTEYLQTPGRPGTVTLDMIEAETAIRWTADRAQIQKAAADIEKRTGYKLLRGARGRPPVFEVPGRRYDF
jgi:hypothetical protein